MRECGSCTACCEGWLPAQVNGHHYFRGRYCHYLKKDVGCSIYSDRPQQCRNFHCAWIKDDGTNFPDWMQPNQSGVILDWRQREDGGMDLGMVEASEEKVKPEILSWCMQYAFNNNLDFYYEINGTWLSLKFETERK